MRRASRMTALAAALAVWGTASPAQQVDPDAGSLTGDDLYEFDLDQLLMQEQGLFGDEAPPDPPPPRAETASGGVLLRALDKVSGEVVDFDLMPDQTKQLGRIQVTLGECRYPVGNPAGDAYAYLRIRNAGAPAYGFEGWMVASSPALNGLDDPRYDVWVLRCITSS